MASEALSMVAKSRLADGDATASARSSEISPGYRSLRCATFRFAPRLRTSPLLSAGKSRRRRSALVEQVPGCQFIGQGFLVDKFALPGQSEAWS